MQRVRRLASRHSVRLAERCFVVEGVKVVRDAIDAGVEVESLYVERSATGSDHALDDLLDRARDEGIRAFELAPGVLDRVAGTVTPQPALAVVRQMDVPLESLNPARRAEAHHDAALVVVCIDLRDPGNAGTVVRSAEAAGASGVVFCDGSVDVFNPKTVRASAGSLFRLPVVAGGDPEDVLAELGGFGLARLASHAHTGETYSDADLTGPVALVVGNEAHGLPDGLDDVLDGWLTIPMSGRAESLNAGMAAAVLCFEAARQRRTRQPADGAGDGAGGAGVAGVAGVAI